MSDKTVEVELENGLLEAAHTPPILLSRTDFDGIRERIQARTEPWNS